jgi:hypothetical protein
MPLTSEFIVGTIVVMGEMPKDDYLPKIRLEPQRKKRYRQAWLRAKAKAAKQGHGLFFGEWVRQACDLAAERDLGE